MSPVSNTIEAQLRTLLPSDQVLIGNDILSAYKSDFIGTDVGFAEAYFKVYNTEQVQKVVRFAYDHDLPITIRAAGTNLVGSTIPHGGIIIDMSAMNKILELDEENHTILVEPGVLLCDLQQYVEERGLFYPPDPAEKHATIGGNIATNAGGMRAVKYGVTRDFVLGLEVVSAEGKVIDLGSKCLKDATGLNLKQLFIGSEGTLGVITKCLLRLINKPEATAHALVGFSSLREAITAVNDLHAANLAPTAIEFVEKKVIAFGEAFLQQEFPLPQCAAYLVITFDGATVEMPEKIARCQQVLSAKHQIEFLDLKDETVAQRVWTVRAALAKAVQASGIWEPVDTVVPLSDIATFVDYISELSEETGIRILAFGHAGDGNVHLCILKDALPAEQWPAKLDVVLTKLYRRVYQLHGKVAAEHGIGRHKRKYFMQEVGANELDLMRRIKYALDHKGLFNSHSGYTA